MTQHIQLAPEQIKQYNLLFSYDRQAAKRYIRSIINYRRGERFAPDDYPCRKNSPSSEQIGEAIELRREGHSYRRISNLTGIPQTTLRRICKKYGLNREIINGINRGKIYTLHALGLKNIEIAEYLGISTKTVWIYFKKLGLKSNSHISDEQKSQAQHLRKSGFTFKQIAEEIGVHYTTVPHLL